MSSLEKEDSPKPHYREFVRPTYVMTTLDNGLAIWLDLADYGVSRACLNNTYEPEELNFISNFLKPGSTFVDVGANIGWFSLHAAQTVGKTGRVIAIEPRQATMQLLERSVEANRYRSFVELYNCALGDKETCSRIAWAENGGNAGGTWLMVEPNIERELEVKGHCFQETPVVMLDAIVQNRRIDLIKIDIEGVEPLAMKGATKILTEVKPVILSEVNAPLLNLLSHLSAADYIDWYRQFGYKAFLLGQNGELTQEIPLGVAPNGDVVNVVFVPHS